MRIGALSKQAGVSRDTIRFYERHGLISSRSDPEADNKYRIYPQDALLTLEVIRDAQSAGLSIADITVFIGEFLAQNPSDEMADTFLDAKIQEVSARIEASRRFLEMLTQTRDALARAPQDGLNEMTRQTGKKTRAP